MVNGVRFVIAKEEDLASGPGDQAWSLKSFCVGEFYYSMKSNRESFWHRHQKGDRERPLCWF